MPAHYVGHPYFDELARQQLDPEFISGERSRGGEVIGILPGSRTQWMVRNLSTLVRSAAIIHRRRPSTRFLVACFRSAHQQMVNDYLRRHAPLPIETHVGRTPEIIELSHACTAVSGSVAFGGTGSV